MDQLQQVLENAVSVQVETRASAMRQLEGWELVPNYHASLQQIYLDTKNDVKIRLLAIISLKNGINKYWRRSAKGAIAAEEKVIIKRNQLAYLHEPLVQLATAQAVVTSKIARFDFPNEWPELLDVLIPQVQASFNSAEPSANFALRYNSLYTLHLSMKALTTKTLPMARKMTQMIAPNVFKYVSSLYNAQIGQLFAILQQQGIQMNEPAVQQQLQQNLSIARVSLKCLRRLVINGYAQFSDAPEVLELIHLLSQHYPQFISLRSSLFQQGHESLTAPSAFLKLVDSFILLVGKLVLDATENRVVDFILAPSSILLCSYFWSLLQQPQLPSVRDELLINLHIQTIKIFKNMISHSDFRVISSKDKDPRLERALNRIETELLVPQFIIEATKLLVSRYLILDEEALEFWENDTEEFQNEADQDQWEFNRRMCAEKLLIVLVSRNKAVLCPMLCDTLKSLPPLSPSSSKEEIILKEAVYCAIGVNSHDLVDYLDFDDWLLNSLAAESKISVSGDHLIKRRIATTISKWVGVKSDKQNRGLVYEILLFYLQQEDVAVRLATVASLHVVLDDFDFETTCFNPFLNQFTSCFMQLLGDVDEFDSKLKIIDCLAVVIERMEGQILPSISPLLQILPELWTRSEGQNMFRASIVAIIAKLVKTLRQESPQLAPMVIPVLQASLDVSNPGHLHLFAEGLDLWLATMQNAPSCSSDLLNFIPSAIAFLEIGNENLKKILHILEAYIVLAPLDTLQRYAEPLFLGIVSKLGSLTAEASHSTLRLIDLTLQSCHAASCTPALFQILVSKGVLARMIQVVLGEESDLNVIIVGFLMVIHRVAIYDAAGLLNCISLQGGDLALQRFVDVNLEKYDALGHVRQRKMCALGLISMIGTGHPVILSKLLGICSIITSVFAEVSNMDRTKAMLFTFEARDGDEDEDSLDYKRRKALHQVDLLYNHESFRSFLEAKFQDCQRITNINILQAIGSLDQEIGRQMSLIL